MLDISNYEKTLKTFEVEDFPLNNHEEVRKATNTSYLPIQIAYESMSRADWIIFYTRSIEAINKKYNADDNCFCYRIIQKDDLIKVLFINEHCESYSGLTDESKESAIIYIIDHMKEKV